MPSKPTSSTATRTPPLTSPSLPSTRPRPTLSQQANTSPSHCRRPVHPPRSTLPRTSISHSAISISTSPSGTPPTDAPARCRFPSPLAEQNSQTNASYDIPMPEPPIRAAVLGYGLAGKVFHCPFISAVPGLELSAIVQRTGDDAAQAYPSARILRSADEALADPNIHLIVVATPSETHFDLAAQALQAGKHVVVDKPITSSSKSARSLVSLAKTHKRILAPFHNRRWDGDFLTLRQLLHENTLGRVVEIVSRFDRYRPLQRPNTWKEIASPATGVLYDLGPHLVDQALALFGPPARITASIRHDRDRTDIDDAFDLVLDYELLS